MGVGNEMYSGLSSFGKIYAFIGLLIGGIICLIAIGVGIYLIFHNINMVKTQGKIIESVCNNPQKGNYLCKIRYTYVVNNQTYEDKNDSYLIQLPVKVGETIDVFYNKDNPAENDISNKKLIGIIMTSVGGFILFLLILNYYFAIKSKGYAAFTGLGNLFNFFGGSRN